jgi:hypothetical protein
LKIWANEGDRLKVINELVKGTRVHGEELSFRKKTGEIITGLFYAEFVTINNEKCILYTIMDVTQSKKDNLALKKIKRELEETLEDFYTLRIGMSKDLEKQQIDSENKKIRERLDELKGNE